jgi:serine/threonine protein kinase
MSPQIVFKTPYTSKCDIWSLGVIYYELLFGTLPGKGSDEFLMAMDIK